jgi:hypothetical protein
MLLGVFGIMLSFFMIGMLPAITGLVFGIVGKNKSREAGFPNGMATAGIVCSIVALGLAILALIACASCAASCASCFSAFSSCLDAYSPSSDYNNYNWDNYNWGGF